VNVAVVPFRATVPGTNPPFAPVPLRKKVCELRVPGAIASENVAETAVPTGTPTEDGGGVEVTTVGGVRSGAAPVVNVHAVSEAIAFPARSRTPVVTRAV
jgi:hypothetical protein